MLIAGPAVYICDECIQLCGEIIDEETDKEKGLSDELLTPKEIKVEVYFIGMLYQRKL